MSEELISMKPKLTVIERDLVTEFTRMKTSKRPWQYLFNHFETKVPRTAKIEHLCDMRDVSMNFLPIKTDDCRTVEFRRPPGVHTPEAAQRWVGFALGFVSAALAPDSESRFLA